MITGNKMLASAALPSLAQAIDRLFEELAGERLAFALVVNIDSTTQYVSNASRPDGMSMIESLLERWKAGRDIPVHSNLH